MTREEARKAAEVMMAFAEGKDIEFRLKHNNIWYTYDGDTAIDGEKIIHNLEFDFTKFDYRIKKEPTYRPFKNKEECWAEMQKHQPVGWIKKDTFNMLITLIDEDICRTDKVIRGYEGAFQEFTFADGTPFGMKEE